MGPQVPAQSTTLPPPHSPEQSTGALQGVVMRPGPVVGPVLGPGPMPIVKGPEGPVGPVVKDPVAGPVVELAGPVVELAGPVVELAGPVVEVVQEIAPGPELPGPVGPKVVVIHIPGPNGITGPVMNQLGPGPILPFALGGGGPGRKGPTPLGPVGPVGPTILEATGPGEIPIGPGEIPISPGEIPIDPGEIPIGALGPGPAGPMTQPQPDTPRPTDPPLLFFAFFFGQSMQSRQLPFCAAGAPV